jgi:hypothetical protein
MKQDRSLKARSVIFNRLPRICKLYTIVFAVTLLCGCQTPTPQVSRVINDGLAETVDNQYGQAWHMSTKSSKTAIRVKALVVIAKDGRVLSATIIKPSGALEIDKSVQSVLDRVHRIAPFEIGATNESRSFYVNFNLKPKA